MVIFKSLLSVHLEVKEIMSKKNLYDLKLTETLQEATIQFINRYDNKYKAMGSPEELIKDPFAEAKQMNSYFPTIAETTLRATGQTEPTNLDLV